MRILVPLGVIALIIILILIRNRQIVKRDSLQKLRDSWGKPVSRAFGPERMENAAGYHRLMSEPESPSGSDQAASSVQVIDDITWNDLDMDQVFRAADACVSSVGEEYLYELFHRPFTAPESLSGRRERIAFYIEDPDTACEELNIFADLGRCRNCSFCETLHEISGAEHISPAACALQFALLIAGILMIVFHIPYGLLFTIVIAVFNLITYFTKRSRASAPLQSVNYLVSLIRVSRRAVSRGTSPVTETLRHDITAALDSLRGISGLGLMITAGGMRGSFIDGLLDYVRMLTHLDLLAFELLRRRITSKLDPVDRLFADMGEWESSIILASYLESLPAWCEADLPDTDTAGAADTSDAPVAGRADISGRREAGGLTILNASHPLLENAVPTGISLTRGVIITGSNASGKSTFLKTAALSVLFAQCTGFAPAESYSAPFFRIYSSMSLKDDIMRQKSYYMAEILSLKRIQDAAALPGPSVICFIDEVLRGTNTVERIAASAQLLRKFSEDGIMTFAATHDLELAGLLRGSFENRHFGEQMRDGDIVFTYELKDGPALSRNAISLLGRLGYDPAMVRAAEAMAERYEQSGEWSL